MEWLRYFFSRTGRVGRSKFWLFLAILAGLMFVSFAAIAAFDFPLYGRLLIIKNLDIRFDALCFVLAPFFIIVMFGAFVVPVKRLHDHNHSGWWLVFYILAPIIFFAMTEDNTRGSGDDTRELFRS